MPIWIITGINGKGKTSLMQAIATEVAFNRGRNLKMQAYIYGITLLNVVTN